MCSCPQWTPPRSWFLCWPSGCENKICMLEVLLLMPSPRCWQQSSSCRSPAKICVSRLCFVPGLQHKYMGSNPAFRALMQLLSKSPVTLLQQTCAYICATEFKHQAGKSARMMQAHNWQTVVDVSAAVQLTDCYTEHWAF